ncbi:MAG TPA: aminotransferase class V-fold PLP-dependent enzyme [Planctomycetota bacterium]|nr:aminotransferase class V-fold PLP-dependent enzyme [Planctomycetota bacterium]
MNRETGSAKGGIFCDHNAGGPADPEVLACFLEVERSCPGNPASVHAAGRRARHVLEDARARIAAAFGVAAVDVVFTSGGTEAANLAVTGLGDRENPVVLAPIEHPAVWEPAQLRGTETWGVRADGTTIVAEPASRAGLLCLMHAQSELGTLQPVAEAASLSHRLAVPLFVDAAQTLGRIALAPVVASGAIVALSPHKAGGLRGHGVLLGHGLRGLLRPLLRGGGQEHGLRPGTQSPALAAANALAIERALATTTERAERMTAARRAFLDALRGTDAEHRVLTPFANSVPNTVMLHFPRVDGRNLLPALDLSGVQASHGSACSSGAPTPPRVLFAIGLGESEARACVRFSVAASDREEVLREAGAIVGDVVARLQKKN